jgi:hypothetical protein
MAEPFLLQVAQLVLQNKTPLHELCILFPNKRAEIFFKQHLSEELNISALAPRLLTAEEFVTEVSGISALKGNALLIEAFKAYSSIKQNASDTFEEFYKWANTALYDFNEIDRHLVDAEALFEDMVSAKTIERWGANTEDEYTLINRYLTTWKSFKPLYTKLKARCLELRMGWQGLAFRKVAEQLDLLDGYLERQNYKQVVFVGFNAFNKAEERIAEHLLREKKAQVFFDADTYYLDDENQEAGQFLRNRLAKWSHFSAVQCLKTSLLNENKSLKVYAAGGNIEQAKMVGSILEQNQYEGKRTAVVLADEALLLPVLSSIPTNHNHINVTMGMGMRLASPAMLVLSVLKVKSKLLSKSSLYYKDLERLLEFPPIGLAIASGNKKVVVDAITQIKNENQTFLSIDQLEQAASKFGLNLDFLHLLFSEADLVEVLRRTIEICKAYCNTVEISQVEKEMYFHVTSATQALMLQLESVNWPVEINVVIDLYKTALSTEQISFYGEPLQGLQVMGILETRTLDFDTVIMTSLNEGILPSGKSNNSFIPFDVRRHYEMPVHKERDAIYAYHFYRLLQRAKNIHLIYNSASSGLGAKEKSRFILQLQSELNGKGVTYEEKEASIYVKEESLNGLDKMEKTAALKNDILAFLKKGVSPTALSEYVRNPLDFYFNRILGVYDADEIEETIGHATLGSVIHDTLENLYKPFIGTFPERNDFDAIKGKASSELRLNFERHYKKGQMREGKNLLIFQVSETMVNNFLTSDRTRAEGFKKEGRTIQILSLEEMLDRSVYVPELDETIRLRGKADRIEKIGNDIYIIDYKTGSVEQQNLNIKSLEDMYNPDLEKEKVLQLLLYAYMYKPNVQNGQNVYGAVASLRKYKAGILKVRTSEFGRSETLVFEGETEKKFENLLLLKICEMYSGKSYFEDINVISLAKTETQS